MSQPREPWSSTKRFASAVPLPEALRQGSPEMLSRSPWLRPNRQSRKVWVHEVSVRGCMDCSRPLALLSIHDRSRPDRHSGAPGSEQSAPTKPATAPQESPKGQVIFSRSTDANGETTTQTGPAQPQVAAAPTAQDPERQAVTFTGFDMDVHLRVEVHQIAVRALLTVRNDGKTPLTRVPLADFVVAQLGPDSRSGKRCGFSGGHAQLRCGPHGAAS